MTDFDPGPLGMATVRAEGDVWTLIFVRDLRQPPARVWTALTDPAELDQWAPFTAADDLSRVSETTLRVGDGADLSDRPAKVLRSEPPTLLEYTWGDDRLRWELAPLDGGTRLTLRHRLSTIEPSAATVAAGWHLCVAVLARLLDDDPVGVIRGRDALNHGWAELKDGYAAKFGTD